MNIKKIRGFGEKAYNFAFRDPALDRFITILEGSIRSGKTFSFHPKIIRWLCRYQVAGLKVMIGVSKQTVYDNLLHDLFEIVGAENYNFNRQSGELYLFDTRWLVMGAKDDGAEKYLRGKTIGVALVEEGTLIPENFMKQLLGRLSPKGARLYINTNPDNPRHHLMKDIIQNKDLADKVEVIHFDMDDNPNLSEETKERNRRAFTGVFKLRFIDGLWVAAEGAIFGSAWSEEENTFTDATRPVGLYGSGGYADTWISVDCGTDHPQVYLRFFDDGDTLWVRKEYVWDSKKEYQQKTNGEYADDLVKFMRETGGDCLVVVPPETAAFKTELVARGIWHEDADNEVLAGISDVSSLLFQRKLKLDKNGCPRTIEAIPAYVWDKKASERGEEKPVKKDDDECDCLRYGVRGRVPSWRIAG